MLWHVCFYHGFLENIEEERVSFLKNFVFLENADFCFLIC